MTRRKRERLRRAANFYYRHYMSWRTAHGWQILPPVVRDACVSYCSVGVDGHSLRELSTHGELLARMGRVRRQKALSLGELRALNRTRI